MTLAPLSFTGYFFWYRIEGSDRWYRFAGNFNDAVATCRMYFGWIEKYNPGVVIELSLGDKPGEKPQGRVFRRAGDVVFEDTDKQLFVLRS